MIICKKSDLITDTIKLIDELKIRYHNKNSLKSHLNSTVPIISRIKEFDKEYQLLAPINTGPAKSYNDERDDNAV